MAQNEMTVQISDFKAQSYVGNYQAEGGPLEVTGGLSTNPEKVLTGFNGQVKANGKVVGNFNGWWNGEKIKYNISDCELENLETVAAAIYASQSAVEEELRKQ